MPEVVEVKEKTVGKEKNVYGGHYACLDNLLASTLCWTCQLYDVSEDYKENDSVAE